MNNWYEIDDFPGYCINEKGDILHNNKKYKKSDIVTLRNGKDTLCIRRKRLLYFAITGISPLKGKNVEVDVVEEDGELKLVNRRERRRLLAINRHSRKKSSDEAIRELEEQIDFAFAVKDAILGHPQRLNNHLEIRRGKLVTYLASYTHKELAEDISIAAVEWYYRAIVERHCTATSFLYLKKKARGMLADYRRLCFGHKTII